VTVCKAMTALLADAWLLPRILDRRMKRALAFACDQTIECLMMIGLLQAFTHSRKGNRFHLYEDSKTTVIRPSITASLTIGVPLSEARLAQDMVTARVLAERVLKPHVLNLMHGGPFGRYA